GRGGGSSSLLWRALLLSHPGLPHCLGEPASVFKGRGHDPMDPTGLAMGGNGDRQPRPNPGTPTIPMGRAAPSNPGGLKILAGGPNRGHSGRNLKPGAGCPDGKVGKVGPRWRTLGEKIGRGTPLLRQNRGSLSGPSGPPHRLELDSNRIGSPV